MLNVCFFVIFVLVWSLQMDLLWCKKHFRLDLTINQWSHRNNSPASLNRWNHDTALFSRLSLIQELNYISEFLKSSLWWKHPPGLSYTSLYNMLKYLSHLHYMLDAFIQSDLHTQYCGQSPQEHCLAQGHNDMLTAVGIEPWSEHERTIHCATASKTFRFNFKFIQKVYI